MADDPDHPTALAETVELVHRELEVVGIEATETLIDEKRVEVHTPGVCLHRVGKTLARRLLGGSTGDD